ncbi:hypothetical protein WDU94_002566 [Cyamophila willieti]
MDIVNDMDEPMIHFQEDDLDLYVRGPTYGTEDAPSGPRLSRYNFRLLKLIFLCILAIFVNDFVNAYRITSAISDLFKGEDVTAEDVRSLTFKVDTMIETIRANELHLVSRLKQELYASYVDETDYASVSQGGAIVNESGVLISTMHNASHLLMGGIQEAGQCWAFQKEAEVIIKLSRSILLTAVTYEHVSLENLPSSDALKSAPRHFSIAALPPGSADPKPLGNFTFDVNGGPSQRFVLKDAMLEPVTFVMVKVKDNHGHKRYTCMYRLRVHGIEEEGDRKE